MTKQTVFFGSLPYPSSDSAEGQATLEIEARDMDWRLDYPHGSSIWEGSLSATWTLDAPTKMNSLEVVVDEWRVIGRVEGEEGEVPMHLISLLEVSSPLSVWPEE